MPLTTKSRLKIYLLIWLCASTAIAEPFCVLSISPHGDISFFSRKGFFYKLFYTKDIVTTQWFSNSQWETTGEDRVLVFTNVLRGSQGFYQMHITPVGGDAPLSVLCP